MATVGRAGTGALLFGGLVLALLMGYTLLAEFWHARTPGADAAEVAVFFPAQSAWADFRQAAHACAGRGVAEIAEKTHDALVLRTPKHRRRVRFTWQGAQGQTETLHEIRRLTERPRPPLAVIGSSNTVLTVVLAEALAQARPAPVLLMTEATADRVAAPGSASGSPVDLLAIHPGRSFRLGLDNRRQAELLTRYLADRDGAANLDRAFIVVDRDDPYSNDLAGAFLDALEGAAPSLAVPSDRETLDLGGRANAPARGERAWAHRVWRAVEEAGTGRKVVVFLPLQEEPARRLLVALQGYGPAATGAGADGPTLRVLCGDGVGRATLDQFAGPLAFPVWSPASWSIPADDADPDVAPHDHEAQVPAEAIAALLACLDVPEGTAPDLARTLRDLDLAADDRRTLGRRLAFDASGERRGGDLGTVLGIEPGDPAVAAHAPRPGGSWADYRWDGRAWRPRSRSRIEAEASPIASRP